MPRPDWQALGRTLKADFPASIVVFLVALPLCMGIAIASGVPPVAGLVTGIVGGLIVGPIAGSPLQVSGPAAGLAVIIWELVQRHGMSALGPVVLGAGLLQLGAGLARLGQWFRAVSPAVIHALLAGIGLLIMGAQFHVLFDQVPKASGLENWLSIPNSLALGLPFGAPLSQAQWAGIVGVVTVAVIALGSYLRGRGIKRLPPAALLGVVAGSTLAAVFDAPVNFVSLPSSLLSELEGFSMAGLQSLGWRDYLIETLAVAFIASAETLLCATAVDQLHQGPRTRYDKEVAAQGIGNMICGLLGALPITGVIVRSSANVDAGAKSRMSATLHGAWILALTIVVPGLLALIPRAALAGVLVYTGYKLAFSGSAKKLRRFGLSEVGIFVATVAVIVLVDLLTGVVLGLALSAAKLLYTFSHLEVDTVEQADGTFRVTLGGAATFLALPRLASALELLPPASRVEIHFAALRYIDHACLNFLSELHLRFSAAGGTLDVAWQELEARYHEAYATRKRRNPSSNPPPGAPT